MTVIFNEIREYFFYCDLLKQYSLIYVKNAPRASFHTTYINLSAIISILTSFFLFYVLFRKNSISDITLFFFFFCSPYMMASRFLLRSWFLFFCIYVVFFFERIRIFLWRHDLVTHQWIWLYMHRREKWKANIKHSQ